MVDSISMRTKKAKIIEEYAPPRKGNGPPPLTPEELAEQAQAVEKYGRGEGVKFRKIKEAKHRGNMKKMEKKFKDATLKAKDAEMLLPEERGFIETEGMERTFKISQSALKKEVDIATAQKVRFTPFPGLTGRRWTW